MRPVEKQRPPSKGGSLECPEEEEIQLMVESFIDEKFTEAYNDDIGKGEDDKGKDDKSKGEDATGKPNNGGANND